MTRLVTCSAFALVLGLAMPTWAQTDEQLNEQELSRITSAVPAPLPSAPPPVAYPAPAYNPYAYCYDPYGNWTGYCGYPYPYGGFYGAGGVAFFGGQRFFHHSFRRGHSGHSGGHGGRGGHSGGRRH